MFMDTILEVKNLCKSFSQGVNSVSVLSGVSLKVQKGETVAILGQSGSGKSTLLSLLSGLDVPDKGQVIISGRELSMLSEKEIAKFRGENVGIIFQQFHLMQHMTAVENVALPLEISKTIGFTEKAKEALNRVGLAHRLDHYPSQLSGGENQRVAIARAFVSNPTILIADEPSGNLDQDTGEQVMDILFKQAEELNTTLILVTHNKSLAARCKQLYQLDHGKLKNLA